MPRKADSGISRRKLLRASAGLLAGTIVAPSGVHPRDAQGKAAPVSSNSRRRFSLIDQGKARASIVLPEGPSPVVQFAAEELRRYLQALSGVSVPLKVGQAELPGKWVLLGSADRLRSMVRGIAQPDWPEQGSDEYVIQVTNDGVVLCGGSDRATVYAVYHLLESLGCRWLAPGQDYLPSLQTVQIEQNVTKIQPALKWRELSLTALPLSVEFIDWFAKQRFNLLSLLPIVMVKRLSRTQVEEIKRRGLTLVAGGHIPIYFLPIEQYSPTHPEWFSLIKGQRSKPGDWPWKMCHSNDQAMETFNDNLIQFLEAHPFVETVEVWENDSPNGWCECSACRALEPDPDRLHPDRPELKAPDRSVTYMRFVKRVSEAIRRRIPGRRVSFGPYYNLTTLPQDPRQLPDRDGLLQLDDYLQCFRHSLADDCNFARMERRAKDWLPAFPESAVWVYYHTRVCGLPVGLTTRIQKDLRFVVRRGINGFIDLVSVGHAPDLADLFEKESLNFYVLAKLAWNPEMDVREPLRDFTLHAYGSSAKAMQSFYELLDQTTYGFGQGALQPEETASLAKLHTGRFMSPRHYIPTLKRLQELKAILGEALGQATDVAVRRRIQPLLTGMQVAEVLWEAEKLPPKERVPWIARLRELAPSQLQPREDDEMIVRGIRQKQTIRTNLGVLVDQWEKEALGK